MFFKIYQQFIYIHKREGFLRAIGLGWVNMVVESDALQVVKEVLEPDLFSPDNPIADQVRSLQSCVQGVVFKYCNREANRVAHELARVCFRSRENLLFQFAIPLCISGVVRLDNHV